jgi:hypothetical protein
MLGEVGRKAQMRRPMKPGNKALYDGTSYEF